jgi:hypothetical protein
MKVADDKGRLAGRSCRRAPAAVRAAEVGFPAGVLDDALNPRLHLGHGWSPVGVVLGAVHAELQQPQHLPLDARLVGDGGVEHLGRPLLLHHRPHPPRQVHAVGVAGEHESGGAPGGAAAQQLQHHHAEAVHVGALRHGARVGHLRGVVPGVPPRQLGGAGELRDAVVGDVGAVARCGDDDVGRFDAAVRRLGSAAVDERHAARRRQRDARPRREVQPRTALRATVCEARKQI